MMLERSEKALASYDTVPYSFLGHDEEKPIPSFSRETKKGSAELHQVTRRIKGGYQSLPSFDQESGECLANDPRKLLERLSQTSQK
jgi:hypothetical protein